MSSTTGERAPDVGDVRPTSVRIEATLDQRMRDYASREGVKLRHIIESGVRMYLDARNA